MQDGQGDGIALNSRLGHRHRKGADPAPVPGIDELANVMPVRAADFIKEVPRKGLHGSKRSGTIPRAINLVERL